MARITTSIMSATNSTLPLYHGTNFDQKQPTGLSSSTHTLDRTTDLMKPSTFAENNGLFTSKPCRVSISGAIGQYAARINGIYEPTDEMVWELPVYVMVGSNHTRRLEYYFLTKSWQAKATEHKGINISSACCKVSTKCLPQDSPVGQWQVYDGKWVPQPAITIAIVPP